jgi:hypothetical protein
VPIHPYSLKAEVNLCTLASTLGYEPLPENLRACTLPRWPPGHPDPDLFTQGS